MTLPPDRIFSAQRFDKEAKFTILGYSILEDFFIKLAAAFSNKIAAARRKGPTDEHRSGHMAAKAAVRRRG